MAIDVLTQIVIDRPRQDVFAFAGDPTNAPRWYANIETVQWETGPPARIGSRMAFVAHFLGRRLAYTRHFRPGWLVWSRLTWRIRCRDLDSGLPRG
jgi:hypothetical protein